MSTPTTSELFNQISPAAPSGDQNIAFVSDGGTPLQSITAYPKTATTALRGVVKPDGATITVAADGTLTATGSGVPCTIGVTIDGGGAPPAVGTKGYIQVPWACTLTGWSLIADQSGSASVDVWAVAGAAPPAAPVLPTAANKISASAPAALASAQAAAGGSAAISTWTAAVSAWSTIGFSVASVTTCTRLLLELQATRG